MPKKKKRNVGRPPKEPEDKTVLRLSIGFPSDETEAIKLVRRQLKSEIGKFWDVNDQLVIHILVMRLMRDMKRKGFSFLKEYVLVID